MKHKHARQILLKQGKLASFAKFEKNYIRQNVKNREKKNKNEHYRYWRKLKNIPRIHTLKETAKQVEQNNSQSCNRRKLKEKKNIEYGISGVPHEIFWGEHFIKNNQHQIYFNNFI